MSRWFLIAGLIAIIGLGTLGMLFAQDTPRLYVVNSLSQNISVIDTGTDAVIGTIPLGLQGYNIAFSPNGQTAYITATPDPAKNAKTLPQLACIDLTTRQPGASIPLGIYPLSTVHVHPDGKHAFVVTAAPPGMRNTQRGQALFVDLPTGKVTQAVQVGLNPLGSTMIPDGSKLYTADWASRSVTVIDLTLRRLKDTLPLGAASARSLAITPDGKKLYTILERQPATLANNAATNYHNRNMLNDNIQYNTQIAQALPMEEKLLWEIDTTTEAVVKYPLEGLSPVYALAVSPDGANLFAYGRVLTPVITRSQTSSDISPAYELVQIDLKSKQTIKQFGNFGYIAGLAFNGDGSKLYLIGTPGDPVKEARARENYLRAQASLSLPATNRAKTSTQEMTDILQELKQLPKTVTVLDAKTGKTLKIIPIGSLPQGSGTPPH